MHLQIISKDTLTPSIWDGGKTYEYVIYPNEAIYSKRNFNLRISSASIEKTPSTFTQFKGYKRYLVMLDNDLILHRNGIIETYVKHEIFEFDSSDTIQLYTLGNDVNVMVKSGSDSLELKIGRLQGEYRNTFIFAFAIAETLLKINGKVIQLKEN